MEGTLVPHPLLQFQPPHVPEGGADSALYACTQVKSLADDEQSGWLKPGQIRKATPKELSAFKATLEVCKWRPCGLPKGDPHSMPAC